VNDSDHETCIICRRPSAAWLLQLTDGMAINGILIQQDVNICPRHTLMDALVELRRRFGRDK
jgi:hypothetical protein